MNSKRFVHLSILRLFCVIVVVFFHCYQMMWAPAHFPNSMMKYKCLYFNIVQCGLINVAMPLFVFISGHLFIYLLQIGKYPTFGNLLRKKGIRLLLPYFIFSLCFMAVTNDWYPLLKGGYGHLWFLPMLFWCFVVGYGVYRLKLSIYVEMIFLIICYVGTFIPRIFPMWMGLHNLSRWLYWFYLGMLVYEYRKVIFLYISKYKLYLPLLIAYVLTAYLSPVAYGYYTWSCVLAVTGCILSIVYLMSSIEWSKYKVTPIILKLSTFTFGIYIYSGIGPFLISNTAKDLFGLSTLAENHMILFPLCFSLVTLTISCGLSWGMMKTKVGRFLIG